MISEERKEKLNILISYLTEKLMHKEEINLIFICVQNSRRSHLAQVIAKDLVCQLGLGDKVNTYSGGVEVSCIHPNTVECLKRLKYNVLQKTEGVNPLYELHLEECGQTISLYSKNFEDVTAHLKKFIAVMVCSESETNCPYVSGAEKKILIPYNDPKEFDNSKDAVSGYISVALQIKEEMQYVFSNIVKCAELE